MIRRRYQEGWLIKKGKVYAYRYREDILDENGKVTERRQPSISFGRVKKEQAIEMRDAFLLKHGIGLKRPKAMMTLTQFWNLHFVPHVAEKKSHFTQKLYTELFRNHIEPALGRTPICDITRDRVDALLSDKLRDDSPTTATMPTLRSRFFNRWPVTPTREPRCPRPTRRTRIGPCVPSTTWRGF